MKKRIAVLAGDGIGKEVIPAGLEVIWHVMNDAPLDAAPALELVEFPWGCEYYLKHGRMMDRDGFDQLQAFDAIYLGAIGDPSAGMCTVLPSGKMRASWLRVIRGQDRTLPTSRCTNGV